MTNAQFTNTPSAAASSEHQVPAASGSSTRAEIRSVRRAKCPMAKKILAKIGALKQRWWFFVARHYLRKGEMSYFPGISADTSPARSTTVLPVTGRF
jgi:hypothetical protein